MIGCWSKHNGPNVLRLSRGIINIGSAGSIFLGCVKHRSSFHIFPNVLQIAKLGWLKALNPPHSLSSTGQLPSFSSSSPFIVHTRKKTMDKSAAVPFYTVCSACTQSLVAGSPRPLAATITSHADSVLCFPTSPYFPPYPPLSFHHGDPIILCIGPKSGVNDQ